MNEDRLRSIAEKLISTGEFRSLSLDEVEELRRLAGIPAESKGVEAECPLWVLMQKNLLWLGESLGGIHSFDEFTEKISRLVSEFSPGGTWAARLTFSVKRSRLLEEIQKGIQTGTFFFRPDLGILEAAVLDLKELAPVIAKKLEEEFAFSPGRGQGSFDASMILGLAVLNQALAARVAESLIGRMPAEVLPAILAFYGRYPDMISSQKLRELLKGKMEPEALREGTNLFGRAAEAGNDILPYIDVLVDATEVGPKSVISPEKTGRLIVEHGSVQQIRSALSSGKEGLSDAVLLQLCWSKRTDALDVLRGGANEEKDSLEEWMRRLAIATLDNASSPPEVIVSTSVLNSWTFYQALVELWMSLNHPERNGLVESFLRSHIEVLRLTARCVQILNSRYDVVEMGIIASRILSSIRREEPAAWLLQRALEAQGVEIPATVTDNELMSGAWDPVRALEFYREHPLLLMDRLTADDDDRFWPPKIPCSVRAILVAGVIGGEQLREFTENAYVHAGLYGSREQAERLMLALVGMGGSVTLFGRSLDRLLMRGAATRCPLDENDHLPLMLYSHSKSVEISRLALSALAEAKHLPEQLAEVILLRSPDPETANVATESFLASSGFVGSLAEGIRNLLEGKIASVERIPGVDMLLLTSSTRIRGGIARALALEDPPSANWATYASFLLRHSLEYDDRTFVYRAFARRMHDAPWVKNFLLLETYNNDGGAEALRAISELKDAEFIRPLLELLATRDPSYYGDQIISGAVLALWKTIAAHPELSIITYSAYDPQDVNRVFLMNEEHDLLEDWKSEALRLTLVGLERRKNPEVARASAGRKILLQHLDRSSVTSGSTVPALSREQFEEIAVYLTVQYVDADLGTVIAEVGEVPSGEIVNALFEGRWFVVFRAVWS